MANQIVSTANSRHRVEAQHHIRQSDVGSVNSSLQLSSRKLMRRIDIVPMSYLVTNSRKAGCSKESSEASSKKEDSLRRGRPTLR
jgi:uncharacterized FlgJ-related protein